MPKNSRLQKQLNDRKKFERTKIGDAAKLRLHSSIPGEVALNQNMNDLDEQGPLTVSFSEFDLNKSKIDSMTQSKLGALFNKLKGVTMSPPSSNGLFRDSVRNVGKYEFLFRDLNSDLNMLEIQFAGEGRLFCHRVRNYLSVIAVRDIHVNLG